MSTRLNATSRFLAVLALLTLTGPAGAQISIEAIGQGFLRSGNGLQNAVTAHGGSVDVLFDATGADKLVIAVGTEHGFNNGAGDVYQVQFNGVDLSAVIEETTDKGTAEIWYLDDPFQGPANIAFSAANPNGGFFAVYGLSGTADGPAGIGDSDATWTDTGGSAWASLTTTAAESLVIACTVNDGNPNYAGTVSADPPLTEDAAGIWGGGRQWGSVAVGHQQVPLAGTTITPTFTTKDGTGFSIHTVAVEFLPGAPPPKLTLKVDTATGAVMLMGDPSAPIAIDYYQVTSAAQSLDPTGWLSLADQDFDGNGPPDGSGNGWEEAGGAGPHALAEAFLLGDSTIAADALVSLGRGYNPNVDAQDLVFSYRTDAGKIVEGLVQYVTGLPGDFNGDAQVEQSDLNLLLQYWGNGNIPSAWTAVFDGLVDQNELNDLLLNWGTGVLGAAQAGPAGAVPEPACLALLALGAAGLACRRKARTW